MAVNEDIQHVEMILPMAAILHRIDDINKHTDTQSSVWSYADALNKEHKNL